MELYKILTPEALTKKAKSLYYEERKEHGVLNGWFLSREIAARADAEMGETAPELRAAGELEQIVEELPIELSENAILAGTQRDAFAASYALINPAFQVETFRGYCDPLEVYDYATPEGEITKERIAAMRSHAAASENVRALSAVYQEFGEYTDEVAFFVEQVTGHMIPDFRPALRHGVRALIEEIDKKLEKGVLDRKHTENLTAMKRSLNCAIRLAQRYAALTHTQQQTADEARKAELELMERTLRRVPEYAGAESVRRLCRQRRPYF